VKIASQIVFKSPDLNTVQLTDK